MSKIKIVCTSTGCLDYAPKQYDEIKKDIDIIRITGSKSKIIFKPLPQDDPTRRKPDVSQARELLDWTPKIALEDGLRRTIDYFRNLKDF